MRRVTVIALVDQGAIYGGSAPLELPPAEDTGNASWWAVGAFLVGLVLLAVCG